MLASSLKTPCSTESPQKIFDFEEAPDVTHLLCPLPVEKTCSYRDVDQVKVLLGGERVALSRCFNGRMRIEGLVPIRLKREDQASL